MVGNKAHKKLLYKYYICAECREEIVIKENKQEMDGGICYLSAVVTGSQELEVTLHDRCLNKFMKKYN